MTDYQPHECDFCSGTVEPLIARKEPLRIGSMIVLVDGATIGKCNRCGHRYWPATIVRRAEEAIKHPDQSLDIESVPIIAA